MKRILAIILNYKTYQMTIDLIEQMKKLDEYARNAYQFAYERYSAEAAGEKFLGNIMHSVPAGKS